MSQTHLFISHDFGRIECEDTRLNVTTIKKSRHREPSSRGERYVFEMLTAMGIKFSIEKEFEDLRSEKGNKLRFDFFFPESNALLELQGGQHYKPSTFQGKISVGEAELLFKQIQKRDKQKKEYALNNGFIYIEVPYLGRAFQLCRDVRMALIKQGIYILNES